MLTNASMLLRTVLAPGIKPKLRSVAIYLPVSLLLLLQFVVHLALQLTCCRTQELDRATVASMSLKNCF